MKPYLLTMILCLSMAISGFAQTTIATMKSTQETVNIRVDWSGGGRITANGIELKNWNQDNIISVINGSVELTATVYGAQLTELSCDNNSLTELNVNGCTALEWLNCSDNSLTELDLTECTALRNLECYYNSLTELDVTKCTELFHLSCYNNSLAELDLTKCTELFYLSCDNNSLTELDLTKCTALIRINASDQSIMLPQITVTSNTITVPNPIIYNGSKPAANNITISDNGIYNNGNITWDLSGNAGNVGFSYTAPLPSGVDEYSFPFTVTVRQPWISAEATAPVAIADMITKNEKVDLFVSWGGSGCITANGVVLAQDDIRNIIAAQADGSVVLETMGDIQWIRLNCSNNSLSQLNVSGCTALESLSCFYNSLDQLDINGCSSLIDLNAQSQRIEVTVPFDATTFNNPVFYTNQTEVEPIQINGNLYVPDAEITIPESGEIEFTTNGIPDAGFSNPFGGTIVVKREKAPTALSSKMKNDITIYSIPEGFAVKDAPISETITVYNIAGQLLYKKVATSHEETIALSKGIYIVKVGKETFKVKN